MKVIKVPISTWAEECVCDACEAILLVNQDDLKIVKDEKSLFQFSCVVCGKTNFIEPPLSAYAALLVKQRG